MIFFEEKNRRIEYALNEHVFNINKHDSIIRSGLTGMKIVTNVQKRIQSIGKILYTY